jgi:hypothetical protein
VRKRWLFRCSPGKGDRRGKSSKKTRISPLQTSPVLPLQERDGTANDRAFDDGIHAIALHDRRAPGKKSRINILRSMALIAAFDDERLHDKHGKRREGVLSR